MREARAAAGRTGMVLLEAGAPSLSSRSRSASCASCWSLWSARTLTVTFFSRAEPGRRRGFRARRTTVAGGRRRLRGAARPYWLVVNVADQAPVLVLVNDCQWADRESLRFLAYLAQRIEGLPVVMLLTGRPPDPAADEAGSLWAQLASRPVWGGAVPAAAEPACRGGAGAGAAGRARQPRFCRACHTATGGNPLFLRELLRALDAAGVAPTAAAASEVQVVGPAAVSRFVLHRLAALGPAATELARAVAVLGDDSDCGSPDASRTSARTRPRKRRPSRPGRYIHRRRAPGVRAPDRARCVVRGPRARRAAGAARRGRRGAGQAGRFG